MSTLQLMATAIGYLTPGRLSSSVLTTIVVVIFGIISGIPLNFADMKKIPGVRVLLTLSPTRYLMMPLLQNDHKNATLDALFNLFICHSKQVNKVNK